MRYFAALFVFLVVFSGMAAGAAGYLPSYSDWQFSYNAENATYSPGSTATVSVENGYANLTGIFTSKVSEGMHFYVNFTANLPATAIDAGILIILDHKQIMKVPAHSGFNSVSFFTTKDYSSGVAITLMLYCYGGKMTVNIEPVTINKPLGGVGEGLLLTGVGLTVVFVVLSILAGIMYFLKFSFKEEKEEKKLISKTVNKNEVTPEVLAAITAALSMYMHGKKFKVISVKPSAWKYYGRLNNVRRLK